MKNKKFLFGGVAVVIILILGLAGNSLLYKGALIPQNFACKTIVSSQTAANEQFTFANEVSPYFANNNMTKGKLAVTAWKFKDCATDAAFSSFRLKMTGAKINLGSIEVHQNTRNVTRLLTDESKAKLQEMKDKFMNGSVTESAQLEFKEPITNLDGAQFSVVTDVTAFGAEGQISAELQLD